MEPMDEDTPSSGQQHSGSTSTPTTSKHPPPSPTPGATPNSSTQTASGQSQSAQLSKRRRGLGVVTPNACTECRKKRAKCDGNKPCGRCKAQKDVECVYEMPVRQSKENLRAEIDQLRRKQRSSESVLAALVRPDQWEEVLQRLRNGQSIEAISEWLGGTLPSGGGAMPNFSQRPAAVPNHLAPLTTYGPTTGAGYTTAAHRVATNSPLSAHPQGFRPENVEPNSPWSGHFSGHDPALSTRSNSHAEGMSWTTENRVPPQSRVGSWVETIINPVIPEHKFRGMDQVLAPEVPEMKIPASTWTNITTDNALVQHLLALYFCWEYPTFASLSKEHFLRDFTHGRQRYCSPILTNALLALGCRFSSHPDTRMNPEDPYTSGDHFFKESQRLFHLEDNHHNLTTIQALGIMSIREASCGRDSESWYYAGQSVRLAIEMGLHRISDEEGADEDHIAVQAATFWGAFALDHAWSLATGSLPQCSAFPHLPPKPAIIDDVEASLWIPYTDDGAPLQRACEQPSNVRSVYKCFCELSELVHQSLYILHSPGRPLTSRELLNIYTQYLNWYDKIPEVLRLGHNFTPAVLFAHMYYHFAILLLFRPLIKLRIVGSSILPKDVCAQAADAIQGLLRSYSQLYTLRRTPSFVPYFVLTSSIMHLAIAASFTEKGHAVTGGGGTPESQHEKLRMEPRVAESIRRGIEDLTEMAPCHHFAEQALNILKYLARKWELDMELHQASPVAKEATSSLAATLASSGDPEAALRPLTDSLNFFAPNVLEGDYNCSWGRSASTAPTVFGGGGGSEAGMGGGGGGTGAGAGAGGGGGGSEESWPPPPPPPPPGANGSPSGGVPAVPQLSRAASAMENPLFWPFPLQGRPMLPSGNRLEEAGFVLL